jgi:hypothetical protein
MHESTTSETSEKNIPNIIQDSIKNHFDQCVFLEASANEDPKSYLNLYISITFGIQKSLVKTPKRFSVKEWFSDEWTIRFGIRAGDLNLILTNLEAPMECRRFTEPFSYSVDVEHTKQEEAEAIDTSESNKGIKGAISAVPSLSPEISKKIGQQSKSKVAQSIKFSEKKFQVRAQGCSSKPNWFFECAKEGFMLSGSLINEIFAILNIKDYPCTISAKFSVIRSDFFITTIEGLKWDKANPLQKKVIEQRIKKFLYDEFNGELSSVRLCYGRP